MISENVDVLEGENEDIIGALSGNVFFYPMHLAYTLMTSLFVLFYTSISYVR